MRWGRGGSTRRTKEPCGNAMKHLTGTQVRRHDDATGADRAAPPRLSYGFDTETRTEIRGRQRTHKTPANPTCFLSQIMHYNSVSRLQLTCGNTRVDSC